MASPAPPVQLGMKLDIAEEKSGVGCSLPAEGSPPALEPAFSKILNRLSRPESSGQGGARNAALKDLGALIEAAEGDRFFEGSGSGGSLRGMPEILGQVVRALEKFAAPEEKADGVEEHPEVPEKATEVGSLFLKLLGKVEAAKSSPDCPAWKTGLRHMSGPVYIFAITHRLKQPWTSPASQHVAGEVLSLLLRVTECSSVAGFLCGENEGDRGRFAVVLGLLKPHLNKCVSA